MTTQLSHNRQKLADHVREGDVIQHLDGDLVRIEKVGRHNDDFGPVVDLSFAGVKHIPFAVRPHEWLFVCEPDESLPKTLRNGWIKITRNGVETPEFNPEVANLVIQIAQADRKVFADAIEDRNPDLSARLRGRE